jgi:hypothetical protein
MIEAMFVALKVNTTAQIHPSNKPRELSVRSAAPPVGVSFDLIIPRYTRLLNTLPQEPTQWTADGAATIEGRMVSNPLRRRVVKARIVQTRMGAPLLE